MSIFQFQWLRRLIRRNTRPIDVDRATVWKSRLSLIYMLLAWNGFGFVMYAVCTGKSDWAKYHGIKSDEQLNMSPGHQWAKTLGIKNADVYRVSGLKVSRVEGHENKTESVDAQTNNNINT